MYFFIFIVFLIEIHVSTQCRPRCGSMLFAYVPKGDTSLIWVNIIVSMCVVENHDRQKSSAKKHAPWKQLVLQLELLNYVSIWTTIF